MLAASIDDHRQPPHAPSHVGGRTSENFAARRRDALDDVLARLDGKPIRVLAAPEHRV